MPALTAIYNHYVVNSHVTFDTQPFTPEQRLADWFVQFDAASGPYRLLVAEVGEGEDRGQVVGYAAGTRFRPKPAYRTSIETCVYLDPEWVGRGVGRYVYGALMGLLDSMPDVHRAYAGVALPNDASQRLHEGVGFRPVGVLREVGFKFGRFYNVAWYERVCSVGNSR